MIKNSKFIWFFFTSYLFYLLFIIIKITCSKEINEENLSFLVEENLEKIYIQMYLISEDRIQKKKKKLQYKMIKNKENKQIHTFDVLNKFVK